MDYVAFFNQATTSSRAHPARGRRKAPAAAAYPRKARPAVVQHRPKEGRVEVERRDDEVGGHATTVAAEPRSSSERKLPLRGHLPSDVGHADVVGGVGKRKGAR